MFLHKECFGVNITERNYMKKEEIKEMIEKSVFVIDIFLSSNSKTCAFVQRRVYTHSSIQTVDSFF